MAEFILGVDPGRRRVGVATADLETRFARPLEVIDVRERDPFARIAELVTEMNVATVVVGRPLALDGSAGPAVEEQQRFVAHLRAATDATIEEFDERLTTVIAERSMQDAGKSARQRSSQRDAVAAQVLLQDYLDTRR
ncbi:MAG TPA: Holliday junction resolvase RuvX [Actinomycetota bacterium]|nr:Holliday junction resolvase RuvX [Actinomycetota bacterium]